MQPSRHLLAAFATSLVTLGVSALAHAAGSGLAGNYHIHGQNPDGRTYEGALHIEQKGDVYGVTWESGGTTRGIGVLAGNQLVVAYGDAACGVIAYAVIVLFYTSLSLWRLRRSLG